MEAYATVEEYRIDAGDESTAAERVEAVLAQQSAKLRAKLGIAASRALTADQAAMARLLVTDAARRARRRAASASTASARRRHSATRRAAPTSTATR